MNAIAPLRLPRSARALVLLGVSLAHLALLVLLWLAPGPPPRQTGDSGLAVFALAAPAPAPVPPQAPPKPVLPAPEALPEPPPPAPPAAGPPGEGLATCDPPARLAAALADDVQARTAIDAAPPAVRSVAEAVSVWNAGWSEATAAPDAPLAAVRRATESVVAGLDPTCRAAPVVGPRLVIVPSAHGATLLSFGSDRWSWGELIADMPSPGDAPEFFARR